jgi:Fe-S-cluster containining protein
MDPDALRALRSVLLRTEEVRGDLLRLAARVIALEDEVTRLGGDEATVARREAEVLSRIQAGDDASHHRLHLAGAVDKYEVSSDGGPPCAELIPICQARCCKLSFPLSTQDLDEGVIRFDVGRPYLIAHGDDDHCVHLDRASRGCGVYHHRPGICRAYDCRGDRRIWSDFATRTLAPPGVEAPDPDELDLFERARLRELALAGESSSVRGQGGSSGP